MRRGYMALLLALAGCESEPERTLADIENDADLANVEFTAANLEAPLDNVGLPKSEVTASKKSVETESFPADLRVTDARRIIVSAGHVCGSVVDIKHTRESPIAECDDGETYRLVRVLKPTRQDLAMKCSAMKELGVEGGC